MSKFPVLSLPDALRSHARAAFIEQVLAAVPAGEIGCVTRCTTTLSQRAKRLGQTGVVLSVGKTFQMLGLRTPSKRIC